MIEQRIKEAMAEKGISIYEVSKSTGIRYELLRRTLNESRKLRADELLIILSKTDIELSDIN